MNYDFFESLRVLLRNSVRNGRESIVMYGALLLSVGILTAHSLWWLLLGLILIFVLWLMTGALTAIAMQLGNVTAPSDIFDAIDDQNKTLNKIIDFFANVRNKFRKDETNGSDSSDSLHSEQ